VVASFIPLFYRQYINIEYLTPAYENRNMFWLLVHFHAAFLIDTGWAEQSCKLNQDMVPRWALRMQPCDLKNPDLKTPKKKVFESIRLSSRCAKFWNVKTQNGKTEKILAGTKVLKLENGNVLFYSKGTLHEGEVKEESFTGKSNCKQAEKISKEVFINEARMMIEVSKSLQGEPDDAAFAEKIAQVEKKLNQLEKIPDIEFQQKVEAWNRKMSSIKSANPVDRLSSIASFFSVSFNPSSSNQKTYQENTALIPLSESWFQSNPELKAFYDREWVKENPYARINYGESGEVLIRESNPKGLPEQMGYEYMVNLIEKTRDLIHESSDPVLKKSPEAIWIENNLNTLKNEKKSMVFFFKDAWSADPQKSNWADFVGIDPYLGGIQSDGLLSVAMHESNMANASFFPHDTHVNPSHVNALFACVEEKGIAAFKQSPENIRMLMGINPDLSILYADFFFTQTDQSKVK